jgi:hypothetical protein
VVRLLGGLAITVMTLYCSPRARTGKGRGSEGGGLYPELAAYRISEGSSPNVQAEVGRQVALLPIEQARAELARRGLELDEKAVRRIANELGAQMLAARTRDLLRFRRGELPPGRDQRGQGEIKGVRNRFRADSWFLIPLNHAQMGMSAAVSGGGHSALRRARRGCQFRQLTSVSG